MPLFRVCLLLASILGLAACDPGPTGYGTAPPGVSQAQHDAAVQRQRDARRDFYRGPRTGR